MDGSNDEIQLAEQLIRVIECAVLADIDFAAGQNADVRVLRVERADLFHMPQQIVL